MSARIERGLRLALNGPDAHLVKTEVVAVAGFQVDNKKVVQRDLLEGLKNVSVHASLGSSGEFWLKIAGFLTSIGGPNRRGADE